MLNSIPAKICFICVNHLFMKGSQRLTYCLTLTNFLIILACLAFWGAKYNESDSPIASNCIINNFSCLCIIFRIVRLPLCFGGRIFVHFAYPSYSFTFKVFPTKSRSAKFDVYRRRGFKSSAVAGIYVGRFCDMASITGIFPIFIGVSWRQSFGFFSIVESETLWQVKL